MKIDNKEVPSLVEGILSLLFMGRAISQKEMWRQIQGYPSRREITKKEIYQVVRRLRNNDLVDEKRSKENQIYYSIKKSGRIKFLTYKAKTYSRIRSKSSTVVLFDIPEQKRAYRNFLRRLLLSMDFTMLQKSVFITPNKLPQDFFDLLRELDVLKYLLIFEGRIHFIK